MKLRSALLSLAFAVVPLAWGEAPPVPERVAQLSYVEGVIRFQAEHEPVSTTLPDRPLAIGDRLETDHGARAEISLGSAAVRLDERSALAVDALDESTVRLRLEDGVAIVTLRELLENEKFEIATPNATITLAAPGDYRIEAPRDDESYLTVHGGAADVATSAGVVRIADGQRVRLAGAEALANLETPEATTAFDDWVLEREVKLAEAEPPPEFTPFEGEEYDEYRELDGYGEWRDDPSYGRVWMPGYAYSGYDPFRYGGHWVRVGFGWTWVDPSPWGRYTGFNGRWAYLHGLNRWCWVPVRHRRHDRRDARETHPVRPSWNGNPQNPRDERPGRDADEQTPVAGSPGTPRRIEGDRAPTFRRDVETIKGETRARTPVVSTNRPQSPPRQASEPTPRPSNGGGGTMRPSGSSSSSGNSGNSNSNSSSSSTQRPASSSSSSSTMARPKGDPVRSPD